MKHNLYDDESGLRAHESHGNDSFGTSGTTNSENMSSSDSFSAPKSLNSSINLDAFSGMDMGANSNSAQHTLHDATNPATDASTSTVGAAGAADTTSIAGTATAAATASAAMSEPNEKTQGISKAPLLFMLLMGTIFLLLSGYASFERNDNVKEFPQDQFEVSAYGKRMVDYLSSFASSEPPQMRFATLNQEESSKNFGLAFTPNEQQGSDKQLNFPESYNNYIVLYDNAAKAQPETIPVPTQPVQPTPSAQAPQAQAASAQPQVEILTMPDPIPLTPIAVKNADNTLSDAEQFAQNLQKQRYNQLLSAMAASSSVSDNSGGNAVNGGGNSAKSQLIALHNGTSQGSPGPGRGTGLASAPGMAPSMNQGMNPGMNSNMGYGSTGYGSTGYGSTGYGQTDYDVPGVMGTPGPARVEWQTGLSSSQTLAAYQGLVNPNTTLNTRLEPVLSPFLLRQGAILPCVLLTGVNSDLPGMIQAQLTQDVFDSPTGQNLLIPKGSKIIGQYAASPKMGQQRLMLAFNRVIFPNGVAMNLGAQPGSSLDGYSGFDAEVDNHFWQLMGNAILLGGITAGISISVDDRYDEDGDLTVNGALSQGLGQSLGRVLTQVIERNLVVSPTLKVEPGLEFNVTLTQDIYFERPYA